MKEALHQICLEGASEIEMPDDVVPALAEVPAQTSPYVYALPAASLLVAACGGGGAGGGSSTTPPPTAQVPKPSTDAQASRFILKSSLSVSEAEISNIKSIGYEPWLNAQMDAPINQTGVAWLASRGYDQVTADNFFDNEYPGDYMIWNQLMSDANGVRKRVALALSEFFVVSLTGLDFSWRAQAIAFFWDQLNSNAFGNFRKLLEDVTLNPAMGYYLSTRGNRKEDTRTGRVPDENYAREVMQLFTIGLYQLNNDGTRKLDANNQPIETYTNSDVTNLARVFTGYNWDFTGNVKTPATNDPTRLINSTGYVLKPMTIDPTKWEFPSTTSQHSALEVNFLGTNIPANTDGTVALKTALDALFNHANVGPFFSKQMIQRLVTSNPSTAYVDRVAKVFNNNGSGTRGDLRAVFKAILLDDEAMNASGLTAPTFGKVREPILRFVQWGRTFGAASTSGNWRIGNLSDLVSGLGQSALRSPSVFNFFRPGYVPANTAIATNSLVAPEFQLINESSTPGYVNYMTSAIGSTNGVGGDVKAAYTSELAIAHDSTALLDRICLLLAANQISDTTKATIKTALDATTVTQTSTTAEKQRRVYMAVLLVMASPDYLVQK
ncbi:DUF1800 domain-containing protein [Sphingorhabdus lacus]|jgi:uncharacterized protein (DUF1800 family)|uniref:DUF1800 domain-containing protein n=1 Tax=Sphingorhabdus lacus TaxID=392610 RepID=A0A6I6L853_9SPHN|nr:DUF1800 domain-containing protein [Sphingorhabdus lacus]QGY80491.1 DUF1800 domain-containing protein [Sphingorhabdus lacus]